MSIFKCIGLNRLQPKDIGLLQNPINKMTKKQSDTHQYRHIFQDLMTLQFAGSAEEGAHSNDHITSKDPPGKKQPFLIHFLKLHSVEIKYFLK